MYRNASKCYNFAEFTRSVEPLKCISIYAYLLSIGKTNGSATSYYLIMEIVKTNKQCNQFQHEKSLYRTKIMQ